MSGQAAPSWRIGNSKKASKRFVEVQGVASVELHMGTDYLVLVQDVTSG